MRAFTDNQNSAKSLHQLGSLLFLVAALFAMFGTGGCRTTVEGQERSVVRAQGLQGEVELTVEDRTDDDGNGTVKNTYKSRIFKEKLRVRTQGDVYHPDLLSYRAMIGGGLSQYRFEQNQRKDRGEGTLTEYDIFGEVLSKKKYPMTFHFDKSEDLIPRQFASSLQSQREGAAGSIAWRSPVVPMMLHYSQGMTEQYGQSLEDRDLFQIEDQRLTYSADHDFTEHSQLSFNLQSNDVKQIQSNSTSRRQENIYTLRHGHAFGSEKKQRLDSFIDYLDQYGDFDLQRLLWQEQLRLIHSKTLRSDFSAVYNESVRPAFKNNEIRGEARIQHQLYDSLTTTGKGSVSRANFSQGSDLDRLNAGVDFDYTKLNRWGRLTGRYGLDWLDLKQTGGQVKVSVVNERHAFTVTGSLRIELNRTNIDATTLVVLSHDRVRTYSDYTISQTAGLTEIIITPGGDIVSDGDQILSIDYEFFTDPQREEQALMHVFRVRQRFKHGYSLYYRFQDRHQELASTETTIVPDEFTINLFGADYVTRNLRLLAEFRDEQSTRIPSRGTRIEGNYKWQIQPNMRLMFNAANRWIDYTGPTPYQVVLLTLGTEFVAQVTRQFDLSARIDYRDEDDSRQGETRGFQWDFHGKYFYRQLDVRFGVEYNTLDRFNHERRGLFQYLRLRRMF